MKHLAAVDYYEVLSVATDATAPEIRKAFRRHLLELHPDKAAEPAHPEALGLVIEAFEVLGNADLRQDYDRWRLWRSSDATEDDRRVPKTPHVTESTRPIDQARSVLYLLLNERGGEAIERLREVEQEPVAFLNQHLDHEEFVDVSFLLGEAFEAEKQSIVALQWYQLVLTRERDRRRPRPCYAEAVSRVKRLLFQHAGPKQDPRVTLQYLRRIEALGLLRSERAELLRRRAQSYVELDMLATAADALKEAMRLQPQVEIKKELRDALAQYL